MSRAPIALSLAGGMVLTLAVSATAAVIIPNAPRTGGLSQVGPIADHGFPAWYRDSNGVRLEACVTLDDPLCSTLPDEVPNPELPVSYPDNFPGEFFYQLAGAELTLANGVDATIGMDLEGAWAAEEVRDGDQMVFGRVRIRFDAPAGEKYRITHPYGIDEIVADEKKGVNMTEDVGTTPGDFGGAFKSRIGPFLKWDPAVAPAAPAGYVGDPGIEHKVVGSPYGTNFVQVERIAANGTVELLGRTDLFSVQGRYATNSGVDIDQATYTVGPDGKGFIEVFATSEPGESIQVTGDPALGFRTTRLAGANGRYYGRFPVTGSVASGASVEVVNAGDTPVAKKTRKLTDVVTVSKVAYDADARTLQVLASSSDRDATPPVLSVGGFGAITTTPFTSVVAPPAAITVTSSSGGSVTVPVSGTGGLMLPDAPSVAAFAPSEAVRGQRIVLDGSGSVGEIDSYSWVQKSGPAVTLTGANTARAEYVPTALGTYTFELAVSGPGGAGGSMALTTRVTEAVAPTASAGADQTVVRGRAVALDATATKAADRLQWSQVSGPAVTLVGATTAKASFTYPLQALPATPGPNATYVTYNAPIVLRLTATGPGGTATDTVTIRPQTEIISGVTARYRNRGEWRIGGTTSVLAGQRVAVVLGSSATGQVIGVTTVDALGAFSVQAATPAPGTTRTVTIISTTGGRVTGAPVTVTN